MSDKVASGEPVSLEDCYQFIFDRVFPLRPQEYCEKYPNWPGQVGIEIEMLPLLLDADRARLLPMHAGQQNLDDLLVRACAVADRWQLQRDGNGRILRVQLEESDQLTFEPGGQLEFSSAPHPCLSDALKRMRAVQAILIKVAKEMGVELRQSGINPWQTPDEIGLQMDKPRYQAMTNYFNRIGPYGVRMMRQTSTLQVNLDFGPDEQTMVNRFMLSQLLAPISTALFANSPCVDGKLTDKRSFRSYIWQHVDAGRTGFPPKLSDINLSSKKVDLVQQYLDFILAADVVFVAGAGYAIPPQGFTFRKWLAEGYQGLKPTLADFETHLSLHFPEVRLRGFLELRSMDAQSRVWQSVPAGVNIALFYDNDTCAKALDILMPYHGRQVDFWHKSSYGMQDGELAELAQKIFQLAMNGLQKLPSCFRAQFEDQKMDVYWDKFTAQRRTPADDMIAIIEKRGTIPPDIFTVLDDLWSQY